jgi:NAD-dependent DNA ligase
MNKTEKAKEKAKEQAKKAKEKEKEQAKKAKEKEKEKEDVKKEKEKEKEDVKKAKEKEKEDVKKAKEKEKEDVKKAKEKVKKSKTEKVKKEKIEKVKKSKTEKVKKEKIEKVKKSKTEKVKKEKTEKVKKEKAKLIIESSSSAKSSKHSKSSKTKTKKRELNILSSLSKHIEDEKTNLKISGQDITMNTVPVPAQVPSGRLNEVFIDVMDKLSDIMMKQGEPFRARAYQKAQETIMTYPTDIINPDQLKGLPHIGPTIMEKLKEYTATGTLKILEREKNNPVNTLADVYGIGPKKAKDLVADGITSISQLRENQHKLNDVQKVGLKYYEDILERIPRSEIDQYADTFGHAFKQASQGSDGRFEIVGSYRRGAKASGDIDVIITAENASIYVQFINLLIKQHIIVEVLSRGSTKCLVITKIPSSNTYRRVDFLYSTPQEYPFSVLYFTGSKIFNTVMRSYALKMGLTMNEHGLYNMTDKKKGDKVGHVFNSEKDIFDFLNLVYKAPNERIDGRAVMVKGVQPLAGEVVPSFALLNVEKEKEKGKSKTLKKREKKVSEKKTLLIIEDDDDNDNKVVDPTIKNIVINFKKNGITVLDGLNENQLSSILRESNKAYYNEQPIMTDNEFDIVKEYIEKKFPSNKVVGEIGAPIERNKAALPYQMWSMDKIKPDTQALSNWMNKYKGPYVLSCKLDGVSGLYSTEGKEPKLYTRGDGKVGQDISHLIPHLRLPKTKGLVIRGEFIIPKAIFDTKFKTKFANPRNMVSGIVIGKKITDLVKELHFVTYEVIKPVLKPSDQMDFIRTIDVVGVLYKITNTLSNEMLSETLIEWRKKYSYEIDGVIVTNDAIYERHAGNPDHAFAFKMVLSDQVAEAKVVDVLWAPSKDGYLKPRVQIEPIHLGGVRIEYATGFNGAFIKDNKIGVGAIIELIRSGDVIPYIRKVVVPAEHAKMPSVPFKWNDTHVDVMLENIDLDETVREKNITGFFRTIGVEGLSGGNVARIVSSGYDTIPKILKMSVDDFLKVDGFKMKTATKLYNGIKDKLASASIVMLMSGSNLFGRGFSEKKIELIMDAYPDVLTNSESIEQKIAKVSAIKGMANKTAEAFVQKIPDFIAFMKEANLEYKLPSTSTMKTKEYDVGHVLYGKSIVMTGFRDAFIQQELKKIGAKEGSSVSKNTFMVLVKDSDADQDSGKALEAKKLGIPIATRDEFLAKYLK